MPFLLSLIKYIKYMKIIIDNKRILKNRPVQTNAVNTADKMTIKPPCKSMTKTINKILGKT